MPGAPDTAFRSGREITTGLNGVTQINSERPQCLAPGTEEDCMRLAVKVVPGSSREGIAGWLGDELKVRVRRAPEAGKANLAVIQLLAKVLQLPENQIRIVAGGASPHKIIEISGLEEPIARQRLAV